MSGRGARRARGAARSAAAAARAAVAGARPAEAELAGDGADARSGEGGQARALPPRPALPAIGAVALGMWAAAAATLAAAETWQAEACGGFALVGVVCAAAAATLLWRARRGALAWALLLGLALGAACGGSGAVALHAGQDRAVGQAGAWRLEVVADGSEGAYGPTCFARTWLADGEQALVRVRLPQDAACPRYGEAYEATGALSVLGASSASYAWRQGAVAELRASDVRRCERVGVAGALVALRERACDVLRADGSGVDRGLAAALVCGWRGGMDEGLYRAFQVTGLAHLVAVSGSHLAIVSSFSLGVLRALRVPRAVAGGMQALLLLAYLVLTAVPPSAVRSAVMAIAASSAYLARRRPAALSALAACMAAFIALDPASALSVSLALSALSTLGIVLFGSLATAWIAHVLPRLPAFACEALALTAASSIMATPLSCALFSQLPLIAPLANAATAPLFAPVCTLGLIAALLGCACPALAGLCTQAACAGAGVMAGAVEVLARAPYASVPATVPLAAAIAASCAFAAALWCAWPAPSRRCAAAGSAACALAIAAAIAVAPRLAPTEIVMLDVGQGDAFLVRSGAACVLVDTGNQDAKLREALARHGVARLDAVVVTHGDDDHMGSLASLDGLVAVDRVLVADDALTCACDACARLRASAEELVGAAGVAGLACGDEVAAGAFRLRVIWPDAFSDEGGNADSLCLLADADVDGDGTGDWRALLVGDAERDQLAELAASGRIGRVDVYKVGHHGSKKALDDELAGVLSPRLALVSAGANNRYGHPAPETLERLEAVGAQVLRTDEEGDVSCRFEPGRIDVATQR